MSDCPCCRHSLLLPLYAVESIPAFQNKVHDDPAEARAASTGRVDLVQCAKCGFVFNAAFDPGLMDYDPGYQNEQAHSPLFQGHLEAVAGLIMAEAPPPRRVVEIGCGKGFFLNMLREKGYSAIGFDPASESDDPHIIRRYFGPDTNPEPRDLVVLRHTLEHVPAPVDFLHDIARANAFSGLIYIEVPCFQWIMEHGAFWDIFHEHCNYFTEQTLGGLFSQARIRRTFGGQYLSLTARIDSLKDSPTPGTAPRIIPPFTARLERMKDFVRDHSGLLVWGAGAKGAAFVNLTDPDRRHVAALVDINPKKQGRFVSGTGHPIIDPRSLENHRGRLIVVTNSNYLDEIEAMTKNLENTLIPLEHLL
ncbi:MAG: class I SAM-dependent methyltransferase [Desulfovibrio aminophilus]|uniref:class I SAM-dependent methyltransferase n=1 Tax=Desulfovibrio aminophilus TaxID=81425 RepID=UPI0039E9547B